MIVKVWLAESKDSPCPGAGMWMYYGAITGLCVRRFKENDGKKITFLSFGTPLDNGTHSMKLTGKDEAYLLNDEGKTIEKL